VPTQAPRLSPGEEALALHLRAHGIPFQREVCLIPGRKWRVDFLLEPALVVEIEGGSWQAGRHTRGTGYTKDCEKYNALTLAGFSVLRYTTEMVLKGDAIRDLLEVWGNREETEQ
jgi:very-short-patch-repair endonuclease